MLLTDSNFDHEVIEPDIPVFVDFWASWCIPCKMMDPMLDKLEAEFEGQIKFGKLNVDQNKMTSAKYDIAGVPTFIMMKVGEVVGRVSGAQTESQLREFISGVL